ncbi:MAG: fructosamine kinase family protein [Jatrophihabitans sp.]
MSTPNVFSKTRPGAHPDFYPAEAAGLRWLAEGGARTADVRSVDADHIELRRLHAAAPTVAAAREFGARLAGMHAAGAAAFGSPPPGFAGQLFIGSRPMPSTPHDRWGEFYIAERVRPFLKIAVAVGNVSADQRVDIDRACELVAAGAFDDAEPPARLHGDLWTGNVFWTTDGVVLIDPAAHGGHRETDLAMLSLFGCPLLEEILAGYEASRPLREGWRERIPLHQLHPLAVHAAGYGPGYGRELQHAARQTLLLEGS